MKQKQVFEIRPTCYGRGIIEDVAVTIPCPSCNGSGLLIFIDVLRN